MVLKGAADLKVCLKLPRHIMSSFVKLAVCYRLKYSRGTLAKPTDDDADALLGGVREMTSDDMPLSQQGFGQST